MDELENKVKDLEISRTNDMDYVEQELEKNGDKMETMQNEIARLVNQVNTLQTQQNAQPTPAPRQTPSPTVSSIQQATPFTTAAILVNSKSVGSQEVQDLKNEVQALNARMQAVEKANSTKQSTVFGGRLETSNDLSDNLWNKINATGRVYTPSACFDNGSASFKAPVKGDYYLDMAVRQKGEGGLEVALNCDGTSNFKHSYVGNTRGDSMVCHKTVIASLHAGDVVFGIVRRISGIAEINWCAFHGCLISEDVVPTAPPPYQL